MARAWITKLLIVFGAFSLSTSAVAQEPAEAATPAAETPALETPAATDNVVEIVDDDEGDDADASVSTEEEDKGWGVGAKASYKLGAIAFAANDYVRKHRSSLGFKFSGHYTIPTLDVAVGVMTGFSQWLSSGGGSQEPQEFRWSDTGLGFSREIYTIPVADIALEGSLDVAIPTSRFSQASGLYTSLTPSIGASGKFGPVGLSYSFSYTHYFYQYTSIAFDPSEVDILSRDTGNERLDGGALVAEAGVLPEIEISSQFGVSYSFLEDFKLGVAFGFSDGWSYDNGTITAEDEYTSSFAKVGRGHGQMTNGSVSLGYSPLKNLSMGLAMASMQPWKTADNQGYRFPFFDLESAGSMTSFSFSLSGNY